MGVSGMTTTFAYWSATDLARSIRASEISPIDVVRSSIDRIHQVNDAVNAYCFIYEEEALARAKKAEEAVLRGELLGPLHGVPIAIKDLTPTAGKRTTMGSFALENWIPERNAIIVDRLLEAGAILVGKTTTSEFAFTGFTQTPLWGVTRNPWNTGRTCGGSSGGSGVAVATGTVPLAEGSDMGGSVRTPAAFCGIVGFKPSLGRIPLEWFPTKFDPLLNHGPLTRTVADAALFFDVCHGPAEADPQSLLDRVEIPPELPTRLEGLRLAMSVDFGHYRIDPDVAGNLRSSADALRDAGAQVEDVCLEWSQDFYDSWYDHWRVLHATCFGHYLEIWRDKMHPDYVRLLEEGFALKAVEYKRSEILYSEAWDKLYPILEKYDALLCPTESLPAPEFDRAEYEFDGIDDYGRSLALDMTMQFNALRLPALSVPSGFTVDGLPTAMQIVGRRCDDLTVLKIGYAFEVQRPWVHNRPPL